MFSCDHHNPWALSMNAWITRYFYTPISFAKCVSVSFSWSVFYRLHSIALLPFPILSDAFKLHTLYRTRFTAAQMQLFIYLPETSMKKTDCIRTRHCFFLFFLSFLSSSFIGSSLPVLLCRTSLNSIHIHTHTLHTCIHTHTHTVSLLAACLASVLTQNELKSHTKRKSKC